MTWPTTSLEQHPDRRQVLLHRWISQTFFQSFYIDSHVKRLNIGQRAQIILLTPQGEFPRRPCIGTLGMRILDIGGEEMDIALCRGSIGRENFGHND